MRFQEIMQILLFSCLTLFNVAEIGEQQDKNMLGSVAISLFEAFGQHSVDSTYYELQSLLVYFEFPKNSLLL